MADDRPETLFERIALVVGTILFYGALFSLFAFPYAAIVAWTLLFALLLVAAIRRYRRTMWRPWPKVSPVEDDDDDW